VDFVDTLYICSEVTPRTVRYPNTEKKPLEKQTFEHFFGELMSTSGLPHLAVKQAAQAHIISCALYFGGGERLHPLLTHQLLPQS
jgi:hypothetical protein